MVGATTATTIITRTTIGMDITVVAITTAAMAAA
jgi:hypothetical protein